MDPDTIRLLVEVLAPVVATLAAGQFSRLTGWPARRRGFAR